MNFLPPPATADVSPKNKVIEVPPRPTPKPLILTTPEAVKENSKVKKNFSQCGMPEIDLLDIAYLPSFGISANDVKKKRDSLLRR